MGKHPSGIAALTAALWLAVFYQACVRRWLYTWGARRDEVAGALPGDQVSTAQKPQTTRAITISAPPEAVWPWLAQIGENRGGFYSYSALERAVGADIHNAHRIHPEWQDLHVGDTVWLAKRYGESARQVVAKVRANSHLVLVSPIDFERLQSGENASGAWSFTLIGEADKTRLIMRGNGGAVGHFWFDIPHFVMEQKMMRGIRQRVLRAKQQAVTVTTPLAVKADDQGELPCPRT